MDTGEFETSEFSIHEILYMGSEALTYIVECIPTEAMRDPFDIIAEAEEHFGKPLALNPFRRTPM